MIRLVTTDDAEQLCTIYNYFIENSCITFEEELVTIDAMTSRISDILGKYPWFVFEESGVIKGYAYAARWKGRKAYDFAVETSVYVDINSAGEGIGKALYNDLLSALKKIEMHAIISGIALPNEPSIKLHEKFGFKKVAQFPEVGNKFGKWIDVGYWQVNL